MTIFGANGEMVTYQAAPSGSQLYQCPSCERVIEATGKRKCTGTDLQPHPAKLMDAASEDLRKLVNPADPPNVR